VEQYRESFEQYNEGANELYKWIKDIEFQYDLGMKVNKRKYNRLIQLEIEYRNEAVDLLVLVNYNNRGFKTCMTPPYIPAYIPNYSSINKKREFYTEKEINEMIKSGEGIPKL